MTELSKSVTYIHKKAITIGSGKKVRYEEQENFIINIVVTRWETGNPLSKLAAYNLLISEFGHEKEKDQTEFEKKMKINSGAISAGFSQ